MAVEQLFGLVRLGDDVRPLAQLQRRLARGRPVAPGAGAEPALVQRDRKRLVGKGDLHVAREARYVLTLERPRRRDRTDVADCVAVALLDLGRCDDDVVARPRYRALCGAGNRPGLAGERLYRLERERRLALVADGDEDVRVAGAADDELERLHGAPARQRRVVRRTAAGEEHARAVGKTLLQVQSAQPRGCPRDRAPGEAVGHGCVYTMAAVTVYERHQLGNGIRVLTAPLAHAQSVSCFVMLAAGSRYETPETNGIAHFAEHMFFKGTERRPTARAIATEIR